MPKTEQCQKQQGEWRICEVQSGWANEIADVAALERHIFSDAWTENGIRETLCQENGIVLGIWKGEFLAGYVILYYVLDEGEIARIAVEPSCRRQGAAGRLFERLVEICKRKGIGRLMLEVRESNEAAISFYKKWGFTEDGVRKDYYTKPCEAAILMSKKLCSGEIG